MSAALGLTSLLAALREAGLPVGVSEVARLQQVFALGPRLAAPEDRRLKAILRAVLVKSAEERARFEPVFDTWLGRADAGLSMRDPAVDWRIRAETSPPERPVPPPRRSLRRILYSLGLLLLCLSLGEHAKWATKLSTRSLPRLTPSEIRKRSIMAWVPTFTVKPAEQEWTGRPAFAFAALALLAASGVWFSSRKRRWLPKPGPEPEPEPARKGPPRVFLTPPQLADPQLLEPKEQEALVWGIAHLVVDEPTRGLDLKATVRTTARAGGIPHLVFHRARHPRTVWLWVDEATDDPAIGRIAAEIEASLRAHALPVERALFRGVPEWLVDSNGQGFKPNEVDERRDAALVAILTDGCLLVRQYAADDRRVRVDSLLRSLSHWPQLTVVDFGATPSDMAAILAKHALMRIVPNQLASFLGCDDIELRKAAKTGTEDAAWAASCALAPASVDEASAFEIRRRLNLGTSPWGIRALRVEAPGIFGRLQWRPGDRARRINWLREAEAQPIGGVAPGSLLGRALSFWEEAYDRELKNRENKDEEGTWLETPARQHLAMERAFLALWRDAPSAIPQLYRLHGGILREPIEHQLCEMAPSDWGGAELVHFPWSWTELSTPERMMLQEMALGGGMPPAMLRWPGRLWLAFGMLLGLSAGALCTALLSGIRQEKPIIEYATGTPVDVQYYIHPTSARRWLLTVTTRKSLVQQDIPGGSVVNIRWKRQALPCVSVRPGIEEWRCGTIEHPQHLIEESGLRIGALVLPNSSSWPLDDEAVALLDSGSTDLVFIVNDPVSWGKTIPMEISPTYYHFSKHPQ